MSKVKFGTDGWRAVISEEFTFENVRIVGQAIADFVISKKQPIYKKRQIALGYDTRFLSKEYAETIACILVANGIKVFLSTDSCPTPAVCIEIKDKKLTGGIIITASHNPPRYNGIKYKGYFGGSAGSDIIDKIEDKLGKSKIKTMSFEEALKKKKIVMVDFVKTQLKYIRAYADLKLLKNAKLRVLVDSMNGTGKTYLAEILKNSSIQLDYMYTDDNPGFHGRAPEPNETKLKELMSKVKKGKYNLGIATDGDADRLAVCDDKGRILSGHKLMALLLLHFLKDRKDSGGVIQTICGTGLINNICEDYGIEMIETPVGFKYICKIMTEKDILIGGEETGGVGFKDYLPERDGILSALLIMELVVKRRKSLSGIVKDMNKKYGNYVYERSDLVFDASKRSKLIKGLKNNPLKKVLDKKVVEIKDYDGTKFICEDGSWLLVRLSGTEPKLRIYSETKTRKRSLEYLKFGKKYAFSLM